MTTARSLAILLCLTSSAAFGPVAQAKRGKKSTSSSAAKANPVDASPTEEAGSTPTTSSGSATKETSESSSFWDKDTRETTETKPAASAAPVAQEKGTSESEDNAAAQPTHGTSHAPIKLEASEPKLATVEVAPPPNAPRKSSGNADSPEGVTWKASGWDVTLYGYAGLNIMQDSTQSFGTASGNTIIQRRGTPRGDNMQAQATARDSRLGMRLAPPNVGVVHASVNLEMDFNAPPPVEYTEASSVTQAGMRMRHYYMKVETPFIDILAGQYHDLFGWGGKGFYPSTLAFLGITGEIYHRKPQVRLSKTFSSDFVEFEIAGAALAPVQKNGGYPDIEAGLRLAFNHWTGARQQAYGQPGIGALALGVSAIGRHFEVSEFIENPVATKPGTGYGIAGDLFLPIIPATNARNRGNALSFTGEYSRGTGIADMYSDLTGGLLFPSLPNSMGRTDPTNPPPVYTPNIDSGIVTFDGDRRLRTANWEGLVLNLQYYLPIFRGRVWLAGTYAQIKSTNIQEITPADGWGGIYTKSVYADGTLFVAITDQIQVGIALQRTHQWFGNESVPNPPEPVTATNWRTEFGMNMFF